MNVLRVYDPAECRDGVPIDWERCRTCDGTGKARAREFGRVDTSDGPVFLTPPDGLAALAESCESCAGHGSLKAAALAWLSTTCGAREGENATCTLRPHDDRWHADYRDGELWAGWGGGKPSPTRHHARCEDCGHPAGEGTWVEIGSGFTGGYQRQVTDRLTSEACSALSAGREPADAFQPLATHWSACDERCQHGGPVGTQADDIDNGNPFHVMSESDVEFLGGHPLMLMGRPIEQIYASWRQVDVRTLGWPHDLRPEKLACLCLRCWAAR